jgi:hypothetical protein
MTSGAPYVFSTFIFYSFKLLFHSSFLQLFFNSFCLTFLVYFFYGFYLLVVFLSQFFLWFFFYTIHSSLGIYILFSIFHNIIFLLMPLVSILFSHIFFLFFRVAAGGGGVLFYHMYLHIHTQFFFLMSLLFHIFCYLIVYYGFIAHQTKYAFTKIYTIYSHSWNIFSPWGSLVTMINNLWVFFK